MLIRHMTICAAVLLGISALAANSAQALSSKECSAKYKAAKDAGTLNGMKWNEFRKAQCGADAAAEPAPPPPPPPPPAEKTGAPCVAEQRACNSADDRPAARGVVGEITRKIVGLPGRRWRRRDAQAAPLCR